MKSRILNLVKDWMTIDYFPESRRLWSKNLNKHELSGRQITIQSYQTLRLPRVTVTLQTYQFSVKNFKLLCFLNGDQWRIQDIPKGAPILYGATRSDFSGN